MDDLEEKPTSACGFVLAHNFETLLQRISTSYLELAWLSLKERLIANEIVFAAISWGWMHPGHTVLGKKGNDSPSDYLGFVSERLWDFDLARKTRRIAKKIDRELRTCNPPMMVACCQGRAYKWRMAPDDFRSALRLIEAMCTDEPSDWAPPVVRGHHQEQADARVRVAEAIAARSQSLLDQALAMAKANYSELGYRIVVRGFAAFVDSANFADNEDHLRFPVL